MSEEPTTPTVEEPEEPAEEVRGSKPNDDEYIYIPKSLLYSAITGVVMLIVGGVAGYFLASYTFQRGAANAAPVAVNVDQPAAVVQPTAPAAGWKPGFRAVCASSPVAVSCA